MKKQVRSSVPSQRLCPHNQGHSRICGRALTAVPSQPSARPHSWTVQPMRQCPHNGRALTTNHAAAFADGTTGTAPLTPSQTSAIAGLDGWGMLPSVWRTAQLSQGQPCPHRQSQRQTCVDGMYRPGWMGCVAATRSTEGVTIAVTATGVR